MNDHPLELITATWAGDLAQFALLRASLAQSPLATLPHQVAVQSEDVTAFTHLDADRLYLQPTDEVLPKTVEQGRLRARGMQQRLGRHGTRVVGSLARGTGWPRWPRYVGWQVQQISKLQLALRSQFEYVVIVDSDVVVSPHATVADFQAPAGRVLCPTRPAPADEVHGKVRKWNLQARVLMQLPDEIPPTLDTYFDTPFVLHVPSLRAMVAWLEARYAAPWWQVLLAQPERRWSEFATYRTWLTHHSGAAMAWRAFDCIRYEYDTSDVEALRDRCIAHLANPEVHYLTVHSQSSGRGIKTADAFVPMLMQLLQIPLSASTR